MQRYEFRVVPAPRRGEKARSVKTTEDRFALALTNLMNAMGAEGWDYVRADALPCDERAGLTGGTRTTFQNMLVFRRPVAEAAAPVPEPFFAHEAPVTPRAAAPQVPVAQASAGPARAPAMDPAPLPPLRLGGAQAPAGPSPSIGPAKPELAAE